MRLLIACGLLLCFCAAAAEELCLPRFKDFLVKCRDAYTAAKGQVDSVPVAEKCNSLGSSVNSFENCLNSVMSGNVANDCSFSNEMLSIFLPKEKEETKQKCGDWHVTNIGTQGKPGTAPTSFPSLVMRNENEGSSSSSTGSSGTVWLWLLGIVFSACCLVGAVMGCYHFLSRTSKSEDEDRRHARSVRSRKRDDSSSDSETDFLNICGPSDNDDHQESFSPRVDPRYPPAYPPANAAAYPPANARRTMPDEYFSSSSDSSDSDDPRNPGYRGQGRRPLYPQGRPMNPNVGGQNYPMNYPRGGQNYV